MSPFRRNVIVGATVLVGLFVLGGMIIRFGAAPAELFTKSSFKVHFVTARSDGISEGSQCFYRGVNIGRVTAVKLADNNKDVQIDAEIDRVAALPGNVTGIIRYQSLLGSAAAVHLVLTGDQPEGALESGQTMGAEWIGLDVIPGMGQLSGNLNEAVKKATETLDAINKVVADPKLRDDLAASVTNFRETTESAKRAAANIEKASGEASVAIDQLSKQMTSRLEQLSTLLDNFNSISAKIDKGQGTAGKLVNDPKLYESLVDTSRELNATISDLKRLVEQWEQEGISFKMK